MNIEVIIASIIGLIIWLLIMYEIIRAAVSSALKKQNEKQLDYLNQQTRLLSELLKNNGVGEDKIIDVLDMNKPYFLNKIPGKKKEEPWKPDA